MPTVSTVAVSCPLCGNQLASDHSAEPVCGPCRTARRDYDPAADPAFLLTLEELFLAHPGELVHPRRALGVNVRFRSAVLVAVRRLRRRTGMHIDGHPHSGGYVWRP